MNDLNNILSIVVGKYEKCKELESTIKLTMCDLHNDLDKNYNLMRFQKSQEKHQDKTNFDELINQDKVLTDKYNNLKNDIKSNKVVKNKLNQDIQKIYKMMGSEKRRIKSEHLSKGRKFKVGQRVKILRYSCDYHYPDYYEYGTIWNLIDEVSSIDFVYLVAWDKNKWLGIKSHGEGSLESC